MSCREDKLQELRRQTKEKEVRPEEGEEQELTDETSTFIEVSSNDLSKPPEKGILKRQDLQDSEKWSDEASQSDNQEVTSQLVNNLDTKEDGLTEVERTLKTLNGYHEEILEALHSASSYRSGDSQTTTPQDERKAFPGITGIKRTTDQPETTSGDEDDDIGPSSGSLRIRNLEDLLCQLEQHPDQHLSPTPSEELRLSVPEADRHYLLERKNISDMAKHHLETGLGYLLGHIQPPSASVSKSPGYTRQITAEEEADESADDDDDESTFSSHHLVRSASEEALPVTGKPYDRNLSAKEKEKTKKQDECDYFPSPPSEDSYANSSEENAFLPPPSSSLASSRSDRIQRSQTTASAPSTAHTPGVKRKAKKKFPEYKV